MTESIINDIDTTLTGNATIKVVGVGGAGGNAVQEMIDSGLVGVQFICANTDLQALSKNGAQVKIQLGEKLTRGLGAGANPNVGREAATESINAIRDAIGEKTDMVFITAGLGGGTGTGAAPVIAQAAKDLDCLTVAVVTKPFSFEGIKRQKIAEAGLEELRKYVDSLIIIPNDRLISIAPKKTPIPAMMQKANEVLLNGVRGISDVIRDDGYINVDFADVRTTMAESGLALMGTGMASGENRAREAAQQAISSPLLEDVSLESAKAILYNITGNHDITMEELTEISYMISEAVGNDANIHIIFGVVFDDDMGDNLQVTIIATGIEPSAQLDEEPDRTSQATITTFRQPGSRQALDSRRQLRPQPQPQDVDMAPEGVMPQPVQARPASSQPWYDERIPRSPYVRKHDPRAQRRHNPGQDSLTYDEDDYEIPAFLRTQAD